MALMAEAVEKDGDRQLLHKKSRTTCCSCCANCCSCCIHCLSGFIFLAAIAGLVLCARIFLELPVILNGFRITMNFTQVAVDTPISDSQDSVNVTDQPASSETCKMFVGSVKLLNRTYLPQYNDTSSADFQRTAQLLKAVINTKLNNSLLKVGYRNASIFSLSPNPTTAHFQVLFCNDNATMREIKTDNVLKILKNYSMSEDNVNVTMDVDSLTVGELASCPTYCNSSHSWPWHIVLQENQMTVCIGSLLSSFWVLSSANCLKNRNLSLLSIMVGGGRSFTQKSTLRIDTIIQHPNFTASPVLNNFALIRLSTPMWFTSSLIPICLSQTTQDPDTGSVCSTLDWNFSTDGLSSLAGTVTSGLTCLSKTVYGSLYLKPSLSNISLNQTDRGNALVCMNADGTAYLQGISMYLSNSSLSTSPCLSFTSIGQTISWINSYIQT
ncbi:transmembrane protease serine 11D-like [Rhinoderma darwinii]|uniref:transmembrane protease serine 11D-like n=1 Tax=Rhinoderma darwinii TaxID=43563 RepID=UPI003F66387C